MHPTGFGNALVALDIAGCESVKGRISDLAKLAGLRHLDLTGCRYIGGDVTPKVAAWISGLFQNNGSDDIL